jgi:hypothetical protein
LSKKIGYDFGVSPRYAILTDITFVNHLKVRQALGSGPAAIVMHLLHHEETIDEVALPAVELNPEALRTQIIADGRALLQHLEPNTQGNLSQKAIQGRLQRMGLRTHDNRSGPLTEQPQSQ